MNAPESLAAVSHRYIAVGGVDVFCRIAGDDTAPTVVLLHGFPSSSFQYRRLVPYLGRHFRTIALDYPGFGLSGMPDRGQFSYTFENYAKIVEAVLDKLGVKNFSFYLMDYGVPVGFRVALSNPERVKALIVQNGAPYAEAFGPFWQPLMAYWQSGSDEHRNALRQFLAPQSTQFIYQSGVTDVTDLDPIAWTVDQHFLSRPGNDEIQLDLFYDNRTNAGLFPAMQEYLRTNKPPTLVLWGENDPFLDKAATEAFRRDLPDVQVHLLQSGHCALEDQFEVMAPRIHKFFADNGR